MISVCIPVYNNYVEELVAELSNQIKTNGLICEIILLDDGSEESFKIKNRLLPDFLNVQYLELERNEGRIAVRNKLAALAIYEWLLFLDSDSRIIHQDFLFTYTSQCTRQWDVISGSRIYTAKPPAECNRSLHWTYGRQRETNKKGRQIFMTNNFCIRKSLFQQMSFPDTLQGYGHEDTWMGIQLRKMNAQLLFIDNPVLHNGVEDADAFIKKTKNALYNLSLLQKYVDDKTLQKHVKLFKTFSVQKKLGLSRLVLCICWLLQKMMYFNFRSCRPNLFLFDLYRLGYFTLINRPNHSS